MAEHYTVDVVVVGSTPIARPLSAFFIGRLFFLTAWFSKNGSFDKGYTPDKLLYNMTMAELKRVLFLSSEADPFVKVGGLGDVGGSLPSALLDLRASLDVRLVIPFHSSIRSENFKISREMVFTISRSGDDVPVQVFFVDWNGLSVYLISGEPFSRATKVYDTNAAIDGEKFTFFSLASLELAHRLNWRPDVVHANDWHTAAALFAIWQFRFDLFWSEVKTVLSVHNLCYMGAGSEAALGAYGLPPIHDPILPWWARHTPLPMGLWAADAIVAVSPSYAEEIQTTEYGCGLETFLQTRHNQISGIVNGIDTKTWDPENDEALVLPFTSMSIETRKSTKAYLQTQFGLEVNDSIPLLAMVTRMDQQKGVDIAIEALCQINHLDWQMIFLGSGNPEIETMVRRLESQYPERVCAVIRFDGKLSHQLYGGADMLLMPSRYEPCGLAQMIAMRYGTVPIARSTGGLRDTIKDGITGFLFPDASGTSMASAMQRALGIFSQSEHWKKIQITGMGQDFSWHVSAKAYAELYNSCIKRK